MLHFLRNLAIFRAFLTAFMLVFVQSAAVGQALAPSFPVQQGKSSNWGEYAQIRLTTVAGARRDYGEAEDVSGRNPLVAGPSLPASGVLLASASQPPPVTFAGTPLAEFNVAINPLEEAIVYTRVPRTSGSYELTLKDGSKLALETPDLWDRLPDTQHRFGNFNAPGQLVLLEPDGSERILYDCFSQKTPCVPLDPAVSLDGKQVLFSVYRGEGLRQPDYKGATLPNRYLSDATEAQLHVVDVASGKVTPLKHSPGVFDVSPTWLPDGRIMFASTRIPTRRPALDRIPPGGFDNPQLFIADADGDNASDVSPHEVSTAMHPYLLSNGRVAYGSHWLSHNLAYWKNNGSVNWPGTLANMWVVMDTDIRGGDMTALLGAHRATFKSTGGWPKTMKALHFLGQRKNGDVCVSNYYRGNNLGLGDVFCWPPEVTGVEGKLPRFLPRKIYNVADWSKSNDEASFSENGVFLGKVGYPEGIDRNQLMLTVGRGFCTQVGGSVKNFLYNGLADLQPAKRACDVGLYRTTRIPSLSMSDLRSIVDRDEWHEFGARVVESREIAPTALSSTNDGTCQLASSDASTAQTRAYRPYNFNSNYKTSANNGGEIDGVPHRELAGLRFWKVVRNRKDQADFKNSIGNQLLLLGDVKLLADNSFKVQLPCDMPYIMAGVDAEGRVIKRDQVPQSLRPGEKRVCTGCHLHSRPGRPYEKSLAFKAMATPLLVPSKVPTYQKDIQPIFKRHCTSCHQNDVPLLDYDRLVWDRFQQAVPEAWRVRVSDSDQANRRYGLQRPYSSKYVNTMFARESLLYWKAANERTDGRKDNTYSDDIDFGPNHPVDITAGELDTLARWLDSGAAK